MVDDARTKTKIKARSSSRRWPMQFRVRLPLASCSEDTVNRANPIDGKITHVPRASRSVSTPSLFNEDLSYAKGQRHFVQPSR